MADIATTPSQIATCYSDRAEIFNHAAGVDLTAGDLVTLNAIGAVILADANDAAANTFLGVALQTVKAGQPIAVLYRGHVYGFTITQNANANVYLSDNAGKAADAASATKSVVVGKVLTLSDRTKVLFVNGLVG